MEPLTEFEIHELVQAMGDGGDTGAPIGSLWTPDANAPAMYLVIHHANLVITDDESEHCVVLQAIPTGEAWVMTLETFIGNRWTNLGFVWDRRAGT